MRLQQFAVMGLAMVVMAVGGVRATAQDPQGKARGMWQSRLEALTTKLNLSQQQQNAIQKVFKEFDEKTTPVDRQLWTLHERECEALTKVLTEEQRNRLPAVLKGVREKELTKIADKLELNSEERQRAKEVCEKYEPMFEDIVHQKGNESFEKLRELRHQVFNAIQSQLTPEHRIKLMGILREEFHQWHDPATRSEHLRDIGDKLGLNESQREQARKVIADFDQQFREPVARFRQLHEEERAALEKNLSEDQRTKLREMLKAGGR